MCYGADNRSSQSKHFTRLSNYRHYLFAAPTTTPTSLEIDVMVDDPQKTGNEIVE